MYVCRRECVLVHTYIHTYKVLDVSYIHVWVSIHTIPPPNLLLLIVSCIIPKTTRKKERKKERKGKEREEGKRKLSHLETKKNLRGFSSRSISSVNSRAY